MKTRLKILLSSGLGRLELESVKFQPEVSTFREFHFRTKIQGNIQNATSYNLQVDK